MQNRKPRKKSASLQTGRTILGRTLVLLAVCGILAFVVLAVKLYDVMIVNHEYYEAKAINNQTRESEIAANRGTIYDANGKILAMSATVYNVFISPYEMNLYGEDPSLIANGLSSLLGVDSAKIREMMDDTASWYKTVAKKLEEEDTAAVRAFISENGLKSVHLELDSKRYYPYSSLACHVIGFVGDENKGLGGLEYVYNEQLSGVNGRIVRLKTERGTDMKFNDFEDYYDAVDGNDVTLTIDSTIQFYLEKELSQAVEDYDVLNGAGCIAMNPKTGEILGMVSLGNFDLNNYAALSDDDMAEIEMITDETEKSEAITAARNLQWRNKTLSDTYEPGSVFKVITLAMGLEEALVDDGSTFFCGGHMEVPGRDTLHCWRAIGHGTQTLSQALENSCNVALTTIGLRIGGERFYDYAEAFGFFGKTGIDLQGEASSIWWDREQFIAESNSNRLSSLAAASFGQTFNITPIQLVTAISATVNGGNLMQPYIVKEIADPDGNVITANEPKVVRQVVSAETSEIVCGILENVVSVGTGGNAAVNGYRIGGKTGTSEKVPEIAAEPGTPKNYIVSFCGVAPMDDPQIVILMLLDTPRNGQPTYISGGVMAAPVVGKMMAEILPYMGIEPVYTDEELQNIDHVVSYVTGLTVAEAESKLKEDGFSVQVVGNGDTVTDQLPAASATVARGTKIIIYAGTAKPETETTVPDLSNKSYSAAKTALENAGLFISTSGVLPSADNAAVSMQSIAAGDSVPYGSVVNVVLVDSSMVGRY